MKLQFILFIHFLPLCLFSQGNEKIQEAFKSKDYKGAQALLLETTKAQPQNAVAWLQLGNAYLYTGKSSEADKAYAKAIEFNIPLLITCFHRSRVYGDLGDVNSSLTWLAKAVDNGYTDVSRISTEPALEKVRLTDEYKKILDALDRKANPCRYNERNREFDFWVGEWQVFDHQQGYRIGSSKIEKLVGDCIIYENWTDTQSVGKSFNYFDPSINKWRQNWVAQNGSVIWYIGEIVNGNMEYEGERINPSGEKVKTRVTFAPEADGTIRQTASDYIDGKWVVNFDADYRPVNK